MKTKAVKNREKVGLGILHIRASFNNTMVSVTDKSGNLLYSASSGSEGFSGSKKSTPYAAAIVTKKVIDALKKLGITQLEIVVSGVGNGRESILRVVGSSGIDIISITDKTPMPHNGCRPRKVKRN